MSEDVFWINRIKTFDSKMHVGLENLINTWLKKHNFYKIKSIEFTHTGSHYAAMIHYQKPEGYNDRKD